MALFLQSEPKAAETAKNETSKALDAYLSGAVKRMNNLPNFEAQKEAEQIAKEADVSKITPADVKAKQAEIKKQMKQYSLKDKFTYFTDPNSTDRAEAKQIMNLATGLILSTAGLLALSGKADAEAAIVSSMAVGYMAARAVEYCVAKNQTPEDKKSAAEYSELKHAQVALKQLKHRMNKDKAARYMEEVKTLFAAGYGNPGGMVTVPSTPSDSKGEVSATSAPKEEKKSSYKDEVKKLYATYGNPSGGFVHKAAIDKKRER